MTTYEDVERACKHAATGAEYSTFDCKDRIIDAWRTYAMFLEEWFESTPERITWSEVKKAQELVARELK